MHSIRTTPMDTPNWHIEKCMGPHPYARAVDIREKLGKREVVFHRESTGIYCPVANGQPMKHSYKELYTD